MTDRPFPLLIHRRVTLTMMSNWKYSLLLEKSPLKSWFLKFFSPPVCSLNPEFGWNVYKLVSTSPLISNWVLSISARIQSSSSPSQNMCLGGYWRETWNDNHDVVIMPTRVDRAFPGDSVPKDSPIRSVKIYEWWSRSESDRQRTIQRSNCPIWS